MEAKWHHFSSETRRVAWNSGKPKSPWKRSETSSRCQKPLWCACWPMPGTILTSLASFGRRELACRTARSWTRPSGTWRCAYRGAPLWMPSSWRSYLACFAEHICQDDPGTLPQEAELGLQEDGGQALSHPGHEGQEGLAPLLWALQKLDSGGLEEGDVQRREPLPANIWEQFQHVQEAHWLGQVGPQVHQEVRQALAQADGLRLL